MRGDFCSGRFSGVDEGVQYPCCLDGAEYTCALNARGQGEPADTGAGGAMIVAPTTVSTPAGDEEARADATATVVSPQPSTSAATTAAATAPGDVVQGGGGGGEGGEGEEGGEGGGEGGGAGAAWGGARLVAAPRPTVRTTPTVEDLGDDGDGGGSPSGGSVASTGRGGIELTSALVDGGPIVYRSPVVHPWHGYSRLNTCLPDLLIFLSSSPPTPQSDRTHATVSETSGLSLTLVE